MATEEVSTPRVQALILADHIYQDQSSGKFVIAGTFHQVEMPLYPATLNRVLGLFISVRGLTGTNNLALAFVHQDSGEPLMRMRPFEVVSEDPEQPMEFAIEIPPLPLPEEGRYRFDLELAGELLGYVRLTARRVPSGDPAPENDE